MAALAVAIALLLTAPPTAPAPDGLAGLAGLNSIDIASGEITRTFQAGIEPDGLAIVPPSR